MRCPNEGLLSDRPLRNKIEVFSENLKTRILPRSVALSVHVAVILSDLSPGPVGHRPENDVGIFENDNGKFENNIGIFENNIGISENNI